MVILILFGSVPNLYSTLQFSMKVFATEINAEWEGELETENQKLESEKEFKVFWSQSLQQLKSKNSFMIHHLEMCWNLRDSNPEIFTPPPEQV
jgi:hypothetical protein